MFLFRHGFRRATFPKGEGFGVGLLHLPGPEEIPVFANTKGGVPDPATKAGHRQIHLGVSVRSG